jgi:hypothetical protein
MMLMSTGLDYVSELRPTTGLWFNTQVIHEHGYPKWNDADRENSRSVQSSSLWKSCQQSHLIASREVLEENYVFCPRNISFILVEFFNMP